MARSRRPTIAEPDPARAPLRLVRRRYHLHVPGIVYVLTTFLMSVGAINSQNNLLFWAFGLAVTALIVSGILSGAALMGVEVTREPIHDTAAGEPLVIRYRVRNRNRFMPAFGLTITEDPRAVRNGPPVSWPRLAEQPRAFITELGAGRSILAESVAPALRRGQAAFDRVIISTTFPFGLTRKSVLFAGPESAIIRPARLRLKPGLLRTLIRKGEQSGSTRTVSPLGDEFFTLREYRPGDATRAVAWRASARAGEWRVRAHSLPGPKRFWVAIDALAADADRSEKAISLAAALISAAHAEGYLVGLWFPAAGQLIPPRQSPSALRTLLNALALADLESTASAPAPPERDAVVMIHADEARAAAGAPGLTHLSVDGLSTQIIQPRIDEPAEAAA